MTQNVGTTSFQFHLVRLKETYNRSTHNLSYAVSIPFSTIKRQFEDWDNDLDTSFNSI